MIEFDKSRLISNIYYLAKKKNIKIGDIETKAGVSLGYISRLNKEENKTVPNIEFLVSVANSLGVSLDSLLENDFSTRTFDENKIISFLDKLTAQTKAYQIAWECETADDIFSHDENEYTRRPVMYHRKNPDKESSEYYFNSFYHQKNKRTKIADSYHAVLNPTTDLFLVESIFSACINGESVMPYDLELYMCVSGKLYPVCSQYRDENTENTTFIPTPFVNLMDALYTAVKETVSQSNLSLEARNAIDFYLKDTAE